MISQIYPTELQLDKTKSSDTEAPIYYLDVSITNGIVSSKISDKQDDLNFEIVNSPFLDGDVPRKLLALREYVLTLMNSTTETHF